MKVWFNNSYQLTPGRELFRSGRRFHLEAYTASHGQLLLRSTAGPDADGMVHDTTIEVLFKPIEAVKIRDAYRGLVIRCATPDEAEDVKDSLPGIDTDESSRVFLLESQGQTDYIVSMAVGWEEGVLRRTQHSFFNTADAYLPVWPMQPLSGVTAGFNVASVEELIEALGASDDHQNRRDRFRLVFVLMVKVDTPGRPEISGSGVFLTQADAEDAKAQLASEVTDCWIETLPIAM